MNVVEILTQNNSYFTQSNFIWDLLRQIGWVVMQGFVMVCDACESLYDEMYQLIDFTQYEGFRDFVSALTPLLYGIFVASLLAIGLMMIAGNRKHLEYIRNVLIAAVVITAVPILFGKLNTIAISGKEAIENSVANNALSLVQGNIDDLLYMANNGVDGNNKFTVTGNSIPADKILNLPYKEIADPKDARLPDGWSEVFQTEVSQYDISTGVYITDTIEGAFLGLFDPPYYYRYKVHYFLIYISLLALAIAYIFTAYKVVRIIWEVSVGYLLSILSAADLTNGQRVIKILNIIKNNYIVLLLLSVFLRLYTIAVQYLGSLNMGAISKTFFLVCLSFCLIDGPNLMEKILGIDAGLSSGFKKAMVFYGAARAGKHLLFGNSINPYDHGFFGNTAEKIKNHMSPENRSGKTMGTVTNMGNMDSMNFTTVDEKSSSLNNQNDNEKRSENKNADTQRMEHMSMSGWHDTQNSQGNKEPQSQAMNVVSSTDTAEKSGSNTTMDISSNMEQTESSSEWHDTRDLKGSTQQTSADTSMDISSDNYNTDQSMMQPTQNIDSQELQSDINIGSMGSEMNTELSGDSMDLSNSIGADMNNEIPSNFKDTADNRVDLTSISDLSGSASNTDASIAGNSIENISGRTDISSYENAEIKNQGLSTALKDGGLSDKTVHVGSDQDKLDGLKGTGKRNTRTSSKTPKISRINKEGGSK